jgi:hypothetical protein
MNDRWAAKCGTGLSPTDSRPLGNERQDDELQSNESARGRPDNYVEAVPFGDF